MPRTGLWLRVFVALLFAVLPPILLLVGAVLLAESVLESVDSSLVATLVVVGAIIWAAMLAIVFARVLSDDLRSILSLAQRGEQLENPELGAAYLQLAAALDERNRQVAALARETSAVPAADEPRRVVAALVSAIRSVMDDPTWRCGVLASDDPALLPPAVYFGLDEPREPEEIGDLERWAAVSTSDASATRAEGPWGAFAVVDVSISERMRAIVYAPWEGRPELSPAEIALLTLVGQHAGTALEHSLLYARVRGQREELNRLAAVQSDFLRGVTHDLQTPLTSIGALASELRANASVPKSARGDLDTISHQAERLRRMVSQLLVASRLEAGVFTPQTEVFAVQPLIERTWKALRAGRTFELVSHGPPHLAVGDPDRLEQVLWAILDNAVKYSPPGSQVHVSVAPAEGMLVIRVRDLGAGMDEETRTHAFDQFFRSDMARRSAPDGSGVGLYAARGLMTAMGGSVEIASTLGSGTTVALFLPAEPSEESE